MRKGKVKEEKAYPLAELTKPNRRDANSWKRPWNSLMAGIGQRRLRNWEKGQRKKFDDRNHEKVLGEIEKW